MNWKAACLLVVSFTVSVGRAGDDQKKELDRFAGTWTVDGLKYDGEEHKLKFKIVFKGGEGKVEGNDKVSNEYAAIKFTIDPKTSPRSIDLVISGGSQTDAKMKGIYEFKDDELRFCVKVFGADRPKDFDAPDGSSTVLVVLKRVAK
jgi:uncharacterized protein (TIGR03067 family)